MSSSTTVNGKLVTRYIVHRILADNKRSFFGVHMAESAEQAIAQARQAYGPLANKMVFEAKEKK